LGGNEVKKKRPIWIVAIAVLQVIAVLVVPPKVLASMNPLLLLVPLPLFAFVAWALVTLRPAGRTLTIFLQGMNIVVRVLITMAKVVPSKAPGTPADLPLLISSLLAVMTSVAILFYVDQPEMQLLFES
jgi:predicted neutral ceramidase superfamily lipid hydrolase